MNFVRGIAVVGLVGLLTASSVGSVEASMLRCKSDPTVLLSDGTLLDLSADVATALWNLTDVNYTLHVPAGQNVVAVVRTPNWPTTKERFTIVADTVPGRYAASTVVRANGSSVGVTVQLIVRTAFASVNGKTGQTLIVQATVPELLDSAVDVLDPLLQ